MKPRIGVLARSYEQFCTYRDEQHPSDEPLWFLGLPSHCVGVPLSRIIELPGAQFNEDNKKLRKLAQKSIVKEG